MGWEREHTPPLSPLKAIRQLQSLLLASLGPPGEEEQERRCHTIPLSTACSEMEREGQEWQMPMQGREAQEQSFGERGKGEHMGQSSWAVEF